MDENKILLEILNKRGIRGEIEIDEFLSKSPQKTYDPFLLSDMKEGVDLILDCINMNKTICIYGDYDADGITSISILKVILDRLSDNITYFIPNRFKDGYGLNRDSIRGLKEQGVDLIITVDCGITATWEVEFCKEIGMDIIITDHHNLEGDKPNCLVINPKRDDCKYPFKYLAGCGVAFKLFQAIQRKTGMDRNIIREVLDIVAIGTIGDIMPLVDENRTFVKFGLSELNKNRRVGIRKLREKIFSGRESLNTQDVSFGIVPHLNAAGRIDDAKIGVELFLTKDEKIADELSDKLIELNKVRKEKQENLFEICKEEYHKFYEDKKFPIIKLDDAHEGITGIVAGKLKDYTKKPIAIVTQEQKEDFIKGTSRSIKKIDIFQVLSNVKYIFEKFGGHKSACGFSMKKENYDEFVKAVDSQMSKFGENDFVEEIEYDMNISTCDVTIKLVKELEKLEPCGEANPIPKFNFENCIVKNITYMGKNEEHVKINVISSENCDINFSRKRGEGDKTIGNNLIDCVIFNISDEKKSFLKKNKNVNIIGKCSINKWNNRENLQILVENIDIC